MRRKVLNTEADSRACPCAAPDTTIFFTMTAAQSAPRPIFPGAFKGAFQTPRIFIFSSPLNRVATIMQAQPSTDDEGREITVQGKGRHDPCVLPRAVPIVEAMAALVLADFILFQKTKSS